MATLTFCRPEGIHRLLPRLLQEAAGDGLAGYATRVVVVDNDPWASAQDYVEGVAAAQRSTEGPEVAYVHEPRPGISAARNAALAAAGSADLLAFVDDDGEPEPGWLLNLLRTLREHGAAAVVGRVRSVYEVPPCRWILAGRFFEGPRRATGTCLPAGPTNNLLLDLRVVRELGLRFDDDLGLVGSEDSLFTRQLVAGGGVIVWCDDAVVVDHVPADRLTRGWVLTRRFRTGASGVLVDLKLAASFGGRMRVRLVALLRSFWESCSAGVAWLAGLLTGSLDLRVRAAARLTGAAGRAAGALGIQYQEYGRGHRRARAARRPSRRPRSADAIGFHGRRSFRRPPPRSSTR